MEAASSRKLVVDVDRDGDDGAVVVGRDSVGSEVPYVDESALFQDGDVPFDSMFENRRKVIPEDAQERIQRNFEGRLISQLQPDVPNDFDLGWIAGTVSHGMQVVTRDTFWKCFQSSDSRAWNWNVYLYPLWLLGLLLRYFVLFPLRVLILVIGTIIFAPFFALVSLDKNVQRRQRAQASLLRFYAFFWLMSFTAVVVVHGTPPIHRPNEIFVANHTSLIDIILLTRVVGFSVVGQRHGGFVGFLQKRLLNCMDPIWFDRSELAQRRLVKKRLREYARDVNRPRILLFPEGTCVNNEYCVMFKRGAFELGAQVVPIAIKYNKIFADCHWNSRRDSFLMHLMRLWTDWACVCEIWFMEPQEIEKDETPDMFAQRVKRLICRKAKLIDVPWDGMYKYVKPSVSFTEAWQRLYAEKLCRRFNVPLAEEGSSSKIDSKKTDAIGEMVKDRRAGRMREAVKQRSLSNFF